MNYRHVYHAGNFGDVLKHAVLARALFHLKRKETPLFFLDTHAGIGRYDLEGEEARRTEEQAGGVAKIWETLNPPVAISPYLEVIQALNSSSPKLRSYPGSPEIARYMLRSQDRILLNELHQQDWLNLKRNFAGDRRIELSCQDGFTLPKAWLPPAERRGLILIDPAFEAKDDLGRVLIALKEGYRRFATGTYLLWYPLKDRTSVAVFHKNLIATGIRKILLVELLIEEPTVSPIFYGSGLIIINPPWPLGQELTDLMPWLVEKLGRGPGANGRVSWLVPE